MVRSWLVGLVASGADLATLALLVDGLGASPSAGNVPALGVGACVQFVGNKRFAFRNRSRLRFGEVAGFTAVELGSLTLNALAFELLIGLALLPYALARIAGTALVYFGFSYPLWRGIFSPPSTPHASPAGAAGKGGSSSPAR